MSNKSKEVIHKDNVIQAVLIADTFEDEFVPLTNDIPLSLLPLLNRPLLDYSLEFLSLGGVEETFLFCTSHIDLIKSHIRKREEESAAWTLNMKVHVLLSESCRSFGDCLRDLDAKGLIRGDFILLEPGVISNIKLLPLLKKHKENVQNDKGAAITLIYQEAGVGQIGRCSQDEVVVAVNPKNRIVFHKKVGATRDKKVMFPLEIFLENSEITVHHDVKDTHIAICSSSVLPLFSDNFDFQTRDDFVRGLLMNEEIMGSTIYFHLVKGNLYGGAVTNWQNYQALSLEINERWTYPFVPSLRENRYSKNNCLVGKSTSIKECTKISRCILDEKIVIGKNVSMEDSFIFSNCNIADNVNIKLSVIGPHCTIKANCSIENSILGQGVIVEKNTNIKDELIQAKKPDFCESSDILGKNAYRIRTQQDDDDNDDPQKVTKLLSLNDLNAKRDEEEDDRDGFSESDDEDLSYTHSPVPDDTKLFFTEVIDSLTRGFEDNLQCDNLILEINSSRYAYNVSVREVNFNVTKAILHMYLRQPTGWRHFSQLLSYFSPILKNYIRNESAMLDCLQAIQDVAITNEDVKENWVLFVLKWFYNKDYLSEDAILQWGKDLEPKTKFAVEVKPFLDWLEEAEEGSSEDE